MIRLATNLLALARMEAGQLSLKAEMLDLSELATEVIERLAPLANAQGVSINVGEMPLRCLCCVLCSKNKPPQTAIRGCY